MLSTCAFKKGLIFCLFVGLLSCRVGPEYEPPCTEVPDSWKGETYVDENFPDTCNWWEIFDDPLLNSLEIEAIQNNPNLDIALARILEAWALAGVSRADLFPQITLNPSVSGVGQLFKIQLPPGANIPGILTTPFRTVQHQYILTLNMIYDLDLWGKYQSRYESAVAHAEGEAQAYYTSLLSLTANLASSYFTLRVLDTSIHILEDTIQTRRRSYELAKARNALGLTNYTDVASAQVELANTEATYYDAKRQRVLQENLIATLMGLPASELRFGDMPINEEPPQIPAGIPSTVIQRRPDIAEAEREMASQHALIGAAYASFFPSFQLTGAIGFLSPDFEQFLSWKSRYWAYGINIAQTIFDAGRNCSELEAAWARFAQASGNYQQTVLIAFQEVEDALNNLEFQRKQAKALLEATQYANVLTNLSTNRYQKGLTNYIEVVTNERSALNAQLNYINVLILEYQATIQLIKALGGGWN